jgi:hypothetical protein
MCRFQFFPAAWFSQIPADLPVTGSGGAQSVEVSGLWIQLFCPGFCWLALLLAARLVEFALFAEEIRR